MKRYFKTTCDLCKWGKGGVVAQCRYCRATDDLLAGRISLKSILYSEQSLKLVGE